jgi:hypothetical protein
MDNDDDEYEWIRKRKRQRWCPCYSPRRVANLRSVILVYSAFVALQMIHWYTTANLPRVRGGRWENPLNDARSFCCVYRHDPCVGGHRAACVIREGRLVVPGDLHVSSYSMLFYGAHAVVFVVASLSLWGPWLWWLFDMEKAWPLREEYTTAGAFVLQAFLLYMRYRVGFPVIQVF